MGDREAKLTTACREIKKHLDASMPPLARSASIQVKWEWVWPARDVQPNAKNADAQLVVTCMGAYFVDAPERAIAMQAIAIDIVNELYGSIFYLASWQIEEAEAVSEKAIPDSTNLSSDDFAARMRGKRFSRGA